jgi:glycosyltransferase involved in cell wall biosynthesis
MIAPSSTRLVLIPSYNTGAKVYETVAAARAAWCPVWVVVDGSDDGTAPGLQAMAAADPGLRVMVLARNQGKGAALLHGLNQTKRSTATCLLNVLQSFCIQLETDYDSGWIDTTRDSYHTSLFYPRVA